ncbi:ABC transporter permease subunit [Anaerocolumna sedimenticola]|uniref:ABC transporter permease subunit n=1 Tax=Anaerocolumna sedimenticola TaxID=2696063 RepID=A0A6P1TP05_9FIRM|nr:carbohydrate ABC transporter permease [Anaerocolumna sedimenticola]QHQ61912.1 ABC transporter permease subunit [Anaerocolumna sedimenticola]
MINKKKKSTYQFCIFIILLIMAVVSLTPFFYLLVTSFVTDMSQVFKNGIALKIKVDMLSIENYKMLLSDNEGLYFSWFKNSIIVTTIFTVLSVLLCSMVGYGISMYEFKGKKFIIILVMSTMMIPIETLMIPLYNEINSFHLLNKYLGVVFPFMVAPFTIYFFLQYAQTLSKEFMDAARIDGCGEFSIFLKVMSPLMKPAFSTMVILQATNAWNDFLWPLIVMSKSKNFTLTVGIQTYLSPYGNNYNLLFAGGVISVIPVVVLFFICQKMFMEGMIQGGIKG